MKNTNTETTFTFIHISDLHFLNNRSQAYRLLTLNWLRRLYGRGIFWQKFLERINIDYANNIGELFHKEFYHTNDDQKVLNRDFVLVTGDLGTVGTIDAISGAKSFLVDKPKPELKNLEIPEKKLCVLPGNHDRYEGSWLGYFSSTSQIFGNHFTKWGNGKRVCPEEFENSTGDRLAVICADFSLLGETFRTKRSAILGTGDADKNTLDQLKKETINIVDKPIIWALHFPPFGDKDSYAMNNDLIMNNWESIIKAAEECNVKYIFTGHLHHGEMVPKTTGKVVVVCAGSTTASSETYFSKIKHKGASWWYGAPDLILHSLHDTTITTKGTEITNVSRINYNFINDNSMTNPVKHSESIPAIK